MVELSEKWAVGLFGQILTRATVQDHGHNLKDQREHGEIIVGRQKTSSAYSVHKRSYNREYEHARDVKRLCNMVDSRLAVHRMLSDGSAMDT